MKTTVFLALLVSAVILPVFASAAELVKVEMNNTTYYESLTVLKPESNQNWIKMGGGTNIVIPELRLIYNGINSTTYTKGDKTIKITTNEIQKNQDYVVNYPFTVHPIYYSTDSVTAQILGTSDLAGKTAYVYLVKTYPTQLKNALSSAVDGDTQPLRNLLNNNIQNKTVVLDSNGDNTTSFGVLNPGDYIVVATLNASTDKNITLISATAFEVLEHHSSIDTSDVTRSSVSEDKFLSGTFTIIGGSSTAKYMYIVALIKKTAYSVDLKLISGGTKATTDLKANNAVLVDNFKIGGVGLKNVNSTTVYNWIENAFPSGSVSLEKGKKTGNTYSFSLPLKGLPDGEYYLNVAAWNSSNSSQRMVAFAQTTVKITTVTPTATPAPAPGGGGGGGVKPPEIVSPYITKYTTARILAKNMESIVKMPEEIEQLTGVFAVVLLSNYEVTPWFTIAAVKELPENVPEAPGDVYKYFEFDMTHTGYLIKITTKFEFKVSKEWMNKKGYKPAQVVLMEYNGKEWRELKTEMTGEDDNFFYFRAETTSFSVFSIVAKPVVAAPTPTVTPITTPTKVPTTPTLAPTLTPTPKPSIIPGFGIVLAVVVFVAIALWRRK